MYEMSDIVDLPIEDVLQYGRKGLVKDIPPIFFDKLQDYIDEKIEDEKEEN